MHRATLFLTCLVFATAVFAQHARSGLQVQFHWSDFREGYWKSFYLKNGRALLLIGNEHAPDDQVSVKWEAREFSQGFEDEIDGALDYVGVFGWLPKYPPDDGDDSVITLCHGLDWHLLVVRGGNAFTSEGSCEKAPGLFLLVEHLERMMGVE